MNCSVVSLCKPVSQFQRMREILPMISLSPEDSAYNALKPRLWRVRDIEEVECPGAVVIRVPRLYPVTKQYDNSVKNKYQKLNMNGHLGC